MFNCRYGFNPKMLLAQLIKIFVRISDKDIDGNGVISNIAFDPDYSEAYDVSRPFVFLFVT